MFCSFKRFLAVWTVDPSKVVVPNTKTSAVVDNLTPASTYHFRILTENSIGLSEPSEMIQITTQEEGLINILLYKIIPRGSC